MKTKCNNAGKLQVEYSNHELIEQEKEMCETDIYPWVVGWNWGKRGHYRLNKHLSGI